jgi:Lon protease-like protein
MSDDVLLPQTFEGDVRLFPLPNVVLFPRGTLPLHIFEPRYRQMTADALAGDRFIAMALLKPGFEEQYENQPPIFSVACLGKIIGEQKLEDGRCNILLRGVSRVRIIKELATAKLYRTARVELIQDDPASLEPADDLREKLSHRVGGWLASLGLEAEQIDKLLKSTMPFGTLSDVLGFALPLSVEFKQTLLEERRAQERVRQLLSYLESHELPAPKGVTAHKFPPDFSSN